jgi:type I restriction enzyme R subunit
MPLIPEKYEVQELLEYLKSVGWEDGKKYGLKEHTLLDTIIHYDVFEKKFKEINEPQFRDLDKAEIKEVLDQAKNILKSSTEEKILEYIKHGIEITVKREKRLFRLIDYENLENNTFYYAHKLKFPGRENVKPDVTLLVNGIPLAMIEAKASTKVKLDLETETVESRR